MESQLTCCTASWLPQAAWCGLAQILHGRAGHVLKKLDIVDLNEVFIVTLNNKYSKQSIIDPIKFFNIDAVTQLANENKFKIEQKIKELPLMSNHIVDHQIK